MLRAVAVKPVDGHHNGEFLAGLMVEGETDGDGNRGVHFLRAWFGMVMRNQVFTQRSFVKSVSFQLVGAMRCTRS